MAGEPLRFLEKWFYDQCNGDWEHEEGITIESLDNPGWMLKINIDYTDLENNALDRIKFERSDEDWIHYWIEDKIFHAACGPLNLSEALSVFRDLAVAAGANSD